jgi:hypothetical protein
VGEAVVQLPGVPPALLELGLLDLGKQVVHVEGVLYQSSDNVESLKTYIQDAQAEGDQEERCLGPGFSGSGLARGIVGLQ